MASVDAGTKTLLLVFASCVTLLGLGVWLARIDAAWFDAIAKTAQVVAWLAAVGVGAFGVWKHFDESGERLRWEKAKLAKELLDDLNSNPLALNATYMLGAWHGRWYERQENGQFTRFQVTQGEVAQVLEPCRAAMTSNENYVRDCYDNFLFHLELCIAAVDSKLTDWDALKPMLLPLFAGIDRGVLLPKLRSYATYLGYHRAEACLPELIEAALTKPAK